VQSTQLCPLMYTGIVFPHDYLLSLGRILGTEIGLYLPNCFFSTISFFPPSSSFLLVPLISFVLSVCTCRFDFAFNEYYFFQSLSIPPLFHSKRFFKILIRFFQYILAFPSTSCFPRSVGTFFAAGFDLFVGFLYTLSQPFLNRPPVFVLLSPPFLFWFCWKVFGKNVTIATFYFALPDI